MVDQGAERTEKLAAVADAERDIRRARVHLEEAVRAARKAGASYADLGAVLGTTRQAAWERFGKDCDPPDARFGGPAALGTGS